MKMRIILALGCSTITLFSGIQAAEQKAFEYELKSGDVKELKALALSLALEAYKRAITLLKPQLNNTGSYKLEQAINGLKGAISSYGSNTRFQLARNYAVNKFNKLPYQFKSMYNKIKNSKKSATDEQIHRAILKAELKVLNTFYRDVIQAMQGKRTSWPHELSELNYKTLLGNWSSFVWQAQSL